MNTVMPLSAATAATVSKAKRNWQKMAALAALGAVAGFALQRRRPLLLALGELGRFAARKLGAAMIKEEPSIQQGNVVTLQPMEQIARSTTINRPRADVFKLMKDMNNVPLLLPTVQLVDRVGERRALWTLRTWKFSPIVDVEIVGNLPNEYLALSFWREGCQIGECMFRILNEANEQSRVTALLRWHRVVAGWGSKAVHMIAINEIDTFLMRLKQLAETGEIATAQ